MRRTSDRLRLNDRRVLVGRRRKAGAEAEGFTLLEVIVSLAVLGIIIIPLTAAFINSIQRTDQVQNRVGASADAQRIASWWAKDVHNVESNGYRPLSGDCPAPFGSTVPVVEQALLTFEWDNATSAIDVDASGNERVIPKKASWVIEGQGPRAELVRRYCEDDAPVSETLVADSFWKQGYDAQKLVHGEGGYGTYDYCPLDDNGTPSDPLDDASRYCTIEVSGNFNYSLTVERRVLGEPPPVAATPPPPTITGVIPGNGTLTPAWLPSVVPPGVAPVDKYKVIVTTAPAAGTTVGQAEVAGDQLSALIDGLTIGDLYWVQVQAHNESGWGLLSEPFGSVSPVPVAPGPPENVAAVSGDGEITVSWDAPTDDGGAAPSAWKVRVRVAATSEIVSISEFPGTALRSAVVDSLTNGQDLIVTVSAINSAGEGPESLPSDVVRPCGVPAAPPEAPTVNDAGGERVRVIYQSPLDNNGCDILYYRVYSSPLVNGSPWDTPDASNEYVTPQVGAGSFTFFVSAVNEAGEGPLSPESAAVDPDNVPTEAPIAAQWEPQWFAAGTNGNPDNVGGRLTWVPLPNIPEYNGGFTIIGYQVVISPVDPGNNGNVPGCPGCFFVDGANSSFFDIGNFQQVTGTYPNEQYRDYEITVAAVNDNGAGPAAELDVLSGGRPLGSPTGIASAAYSASPGSSAIRITWDAIEQTTLNNGGRPITGYQVQWSPNAQDNSNRFDINGIGVTAANLGNFVPGQQYTFKVAARNASGASIPVTTLSVYAPSRPDSVPGSSIVLTRPAGTLGNRLNLNFPAFTTNPGNPTPAYSATCNASGETPVTFTGLSPGNNLLDNPGLTNGKLWNCTVSANLVMFGGSYLQTATSTVGATPFSAPTAPGTPTVTALGGGLARVSWTAPSSNGGSALTGYTVSSSPAAPGFPATVGAGTTQFDTPSALTFGQTYTFTVTATNAAGSGPGASSAGFTPSSSLPTAAPTGLTWEPVHANQIKLTWTPVPDTSPQNGGLPLTKQVITLSPAPTSGSATVDLPVGTNTYTYTTNQLSGTGTPPVNYTATVRAVNANGNGPTASTPARAGGAPLAAVTGMSVSPFNANNTVRLNWTPPANTLQNNGGKSIDGYNITWSTGGGPFTSPYYVGGAGASTTAIGGVNANQAYTFRIYANNQAGNVSGDSAFIASFVAVIPGPPVIAGTATLTPPGNPANTGKLNLYFDAWTVTANSPPIDGYTVSCTSSNGGAPIGPIAVSPGFTELTVTPARTYTCSITATNTFPNSPNGSTTRTGIGPATAY